MSKEFNNLLAVAACGAVVAAAEAVMITLLVRTAVIDIPGPRSSHSVPTPREGGIPIAVVLLVAARLTGGTIAALFAFAVAAFGMLGFTEGTRGLAPGRRLIVRAVGRTMVAVVLVRAGESWLEPHRIHVYQQWCGAGRPHQRVIVTAAAATVLLSLLGAASLAGKPALRVVADLAATGVILAYLRSPALLARHTAREES